MFFSLSASACWDRREINELALVSVAAFDREGDEIVVTVELFRPPAGPAGTVSPQQPISRWSVLATGRGPTVVSAVRDLARKVPRRVYWAQAMAVVVGEEMASRGICEILDFWDRESETRRTTHFLVARGRAAEILSVSQGGLEATLAEEICGLCTTAKFNGYTFVASIHDMIRGIGSDAASAVTGVIEVVPLEQPPVPRSPLPGEDGTPLEPAVVRMAQLTGVALFVGDKLKGTLPISAESRGISAAAGQVRSTILNVPCPCGKSDAGGQEAPGERHFVQLKVKELDTWTEFLGVVRPTGRPDSVPILRYRLTVRSRASLSCQQCEADLTAPDMSKKVQEQAAATIASELEQAVEIAKLTGCDVFRFAETLHISDPGLFKAVKDVWSEALKRAEVTVKAEVTVDASGDIRKTLPR